jgi:hypothetical protein
MGAVMTNVINIDFKEPTSPLVILDALSAEAEKVVDARARIRQIAQAESRSLGDAERLIMALEVLKPSERDLIKLADQIEKGLVSATSEQIQGQLALLLGAFPSNNTPDPKVYSQMMLREVTAAGPSVIALTMACSELRRTLEWPPSIPVVIKAIRDQEAEWQYRLHCASIILKEHSQALSTQMERRAWLARPQAEKEAERKQQLQRLQSLKRALQDKAVKK